MMESIEEPRYLDPLPPIPDDEYRAAIPARLDDSDIFAWFPWVDAVRRGLCDLHGEDYYDEPVEGEYEAPFDADAWRVVQALVLAGFVPDLGSGPLQ